ncbi:MAG: hypothetical protein M0R17_00260 [Candidatus Omnitrophica bacterium]|jgi:hypothetical protein|nr:hypothetical protein [Candidatus Omnitrophota bacterium]
METKKSKSSQSEKSIDEISEDTKIRAKKAELDYIKMREYLKKLYSK